MANGSDDPSHSSIRPSQSAPFLNGGGELGGRMREFDWTTTPLGPPEQWPQSLKTAVRIILTSRQAHFIAWGEDLTYLYNDAYRSIVGGKHPRSLGQPMREVWWEIWDDVGLMVSQALKGDEGTYVEEQLLIMERNGYQEETYYTFSYSPVALDASVGGGAAGFICANTDDTKRVIGERQMTLLNNLSAAAAGARTWQHACELALEALSTNTRDLLFAAMYVEDPDGPDEFVLQNACGLDAGHPLLPERLVPGSSPWPVHEALAHRRGVPIDDLVSLTGDAPLPTGAWARAVSRAIVLPVDEVWRRRGALVVGLNPFRLYDDSYASFLLRVVSQLQANLAGADAYAQERERAEALAALDHAKTTFFSNVSHEFRTPLTLMLGPIEELLASDEASLLQEREQELLKVARRNGLRLQKMVNGLLDFSRIEAGRTQVTYTPIDLAAATKALASNFQSACERAGLALKVNTPQLPEPVYVDQDMWEKIVINLVSNAFKYTLQGEIEVRLGVDSGHALLEVRDTGTGIPEAELPKLFERFHRVVGARGRTVEGSGIGLALVRELVELHGGHVWVESELEVGTCLFVRLPFGKAHLPEESIHTRTPAREVRDEIAAPFVEEALRWVVGTEVGESFESALSPAVRSEAPVHDERILLADDNADMRDYLTRLLRQAGYRVTAVADGSSALAEALKHPPDLVLSDIMMPGIDGFALLRALRAEASTKELPVILLSARAGERERIDGAKAGADDYINKPFSARELIARVDAHVALSRVRREARESLAESEARLREADRRKDEFLATLAHELRNPLAPIRTGLELLREEPAVPEIHERVLQTLERQTKQLIALVDDLMDVSRITRGHLELRKCRVDLQDVVRSAVEASQPLLNSGQHALRVSMCAGPIVLNADPNRLAQVISNLLNNAARYTPAGGNVSLDTRVEDGELVLTVGDSGIGIAPEDLGRIFEMFTQVESEGRRVHGGLGIGLTLVESLVSMHGGSVAARSGGVGLGSQFIVRLPLAETPVQRATPRPALKRGPAGSPRRVLVVDDNEEAAVLLSMMVERFGHEVRTADNGRTALEQARVFRPEFVLMDLGMPQMNGYEAARLMRAESWGADAVLVAISGWGQEEHVRRAREAGFDHHLVKPADPAYLRTLLNPLPSGPR